MSPKGTSAEFVGGGVYDAPLQRAVPQGDFLALRAHRVDKRQPLRQHRGLSGEFVGADAHIGPPSNIRQHSDSSPLSFAVLSSSPKGGAKV